MLRSYGDSGLLLTLPLTNNGLGYWSHQQARYAWTVHYERFRPYLDLQACISRAMRAWTTAISMIRAVMKNLSLAAQVFCAHRDESFAVRRKLILPVKPLQFARRFLDVPFESFSCGSICAVVGRCEHACMFVVPSYAEVTAQLGKVEDSKR